MERHVKERLVGAAVLMAAAIILIPEMLSGPERAPVQETTRAASETPVKTYTIDLQDPAAATSVASAPTETASPPPERDEQSPAVEPNAASAPARESHETNPESVEVSAATPRASERTEVASSAPASRAEPPRPARDEAPPRAEPPPPVAAQTPRARVPTGEGWAVQLGSFSNRDTAERLVSEWRSRREPAFVMPIKSGNATLYRVRIGPMEDRASADAALRRVQTQAAGAAVVTHP